MKRLVLALALVISTAGMARASNLTFSFDTQFSNGTLPGGPAPWFTAVFDDTTASAGNDVRLIITTSGLTGSEFLTETDFSITKLTGANNPQFTSKLISATNGALGAVGGTPASFGLDAFQADGDGKYDMTLGFSSSPPRATAGNTYVIDIGWSGGTLTAGDFDVLATPGGGNGPFYAAAHLQGIGPGGGLSTWIADKDGGVGTCVGCIPNPTDGGTPVPEPASMFLLGSGLIALARRRKKTQTV